MGGIGTWVNGGRYPGYLLAAYLRYPAPLSGVPLIRQNPLKSAYAGQGGGLGGGWVGR